MKKVFLLVLALSCCVTLSYAQDSSKSSSKKKTQTSTSTVKKQSTTTQTAANGLSPKATALLSDLVLLNRPLTLQDVGLMNKYDMQLVDGYVCVPLVVQLSYNVHVDTLQKMGFPIEQINVDKIVSSVPIVAYVDFVRSGLFDHVALKSEVDMSGFSNVPQNERDTTSKAQQSKKERTYEAMLNRFKEYYNPEQGYFQKAYTDKGDPHFMIEDKRGNFKFGIGGQIHFTMFFDYLGSVEGAEFITSKIPSTTDFAPQFGLSACASKINFRASGKVGGKTLFGFFEMGVTAAGNAINLRHAYVSYGGLTVGHTWSTFMDLAAGARTVDLEGPNTQISKRHPLIAYKFPIGKKWSMSFAAELPSLSYVFSTKKVGKDYQSMPDFVIQAKYKGDKGHIQLGAILRDLVYCYEDPTDTLSDGTMAWKSDHNFAWGLAVSGSVLISKKCIFSGQAVVGQGITSYVQDLDASNMEMVFMYNTKTGDYDLKPLPAVGSYLSFQVLWTPRLNSSFIYGVVGVIPQKDVRYEKTIPLKDVLYEQTNEYLMATHYAAANLFFDINQDLSIGGELIFGLATYKNYELNTLKNGMANRINFMINYAF